MLEYYETYIVVLIAGILIGAYLARLYYRKSIRSVALEKVIEFSMIQNSLQNLQSFSEQFNELISNIVEVGRELEEQLNDSKNIEYLYRENFKKENENNESKLKEEKDNSDNIDEINEEPKNERFS
jgi:uncharacterized membrane-anchored protein YhcB (DUF1043 family)